MQSKATPAQIDAALDEVTLKQLTWKPSTMRNIAIKICVRALHEDDRIFWADDIDLSFVEPGDRNCIGMAWRMLVKAGIVKRTDLNRRSTNEASKGRIVFKYRLASAQRAKTFLQRNGWTGTITAKGERLLFPLEQISPPAPEVDVAAHVQKITAQCVGVMGFNQLAREVAIQTQPKVACWFREANSDGQWGEWKPSPVKIEAHDYRRVESGPACPRCQSICIADDNSFRCDRCEMLWPLSALKEADPAPIGFTHPADCMCHDCLPGSREDANTPINATGQLSFEPDGTCSSGPIGPKDAE